MDILRDVIESGESILLLGRPGVGKTTILREAARVLADELGKRVVVVDTSNEIAGDGDVPHPGIGRARRMQVPSPDEQHAVMIEAVENHMPQVIVIDEIGTTAEALAARTIAERGVQLIATAHGNTLENLLQNPTLSDLVGGIQAVTLSDEEARRRGTQKTVLERKAPPTFGVLIEIQDKDRLAVHHDVAEVVDRFLRDVPPRPELRTRTEGGGVEIRRAERPERPERAARPERGRSERGRPERGRSERSRPGRAPRPGSRRRWRKTSPWRPPLRQTTPRRRRCRRSRPSTARRVRIFPYAVSKAKLERALRKFRVSAYIVDDLDAADMVVTLKAQERRQPRRLRDAHVRGIPFYVVRSNTITQMENFLSVGLRRRRPAGGGRRGAARGRGRHRRGPGAGAPGRALAAEQLPPPPPAPDHRALRPDLGEQGGRALPAGGDLSGRQGGQRPGVKSAQPAGAVEGLFRAGLIPLGPAGAGDARPGIALEARASGFLLGEQLRHEHGELGQLRSSRGSSGAFRRLSATTARTGPRSGTLPALPPASGVPGR